MPGINLPPVIQNLLPYLLVVDLVARGFALWKSARDSQKWWFVALLVINSLGILPAIYLLTHRSRPAPAVPVNPEPEYLPPVPEPDKPIKRPSSRRSAPKTS